MACGDKYKYLEVTSSGRTAEDPYGNIFSNIAAYSEWLDLARSLSVEANKRLNELGDLEEQYGGGAYPYWNQLVDLNNKMTAGYQALPSNPYNVILFDDAIDQALAVTADARCLLERADDGIVHYTGTPPAPLRKPWKTSTKILVGTTIVAGIGAAAVFTLRHLRKKRRQSNPRRRAKAA